ncbi:MAG: GAF domain-containing protein [Chloroflexi bacterium]|nr:GAF domain-containing protein [Chloroflexota bacterium]
MRFSFWTSKRRFRKKNGEPVPVEINVELVRDAHGRPLHIQSVVRDISERKRAEEELRQSEEKIQNIIRHSGSMFYTHTPDHVLTYVSPQSRDILDCEPEEAMVRWQEFLSDRPNNIEGIEATERAIQTGQRQPPYELELITHKGRRIWVRVDESPILRDGKTTAIVGSITDITERKQAEAALQESEKFLRLTIDLVPHFIFSKDMESRFLLVNKAVAEAYGTTTSDIVGKSDIDFSATPEQARHFHEDDVAVIKEGKPKFIPEEPITDAQGNTRYLQTTKIPFRFGLDNIPGILGVSVDITEQKQAAEALRESNELLETVFSNTHLMLAYMDREFNFVRVNRAYAEADNRQPDFFPGQNHFALYPNTENQAIFQNVVDTGETYFAYAKPFEYAEHPERGTSYWDWSLVPIKDAAGLVSHLILGLVNVTERRQAEESLRASEEQYRTLFEAAPVGIGVADREGKLLAFNNAMLAPGGYTREDVSLLGNMAGLYYDPEQRRQVMALFNKQGFLRQHPVQFKRKDGSPYDALLTLTPALFENKPCVQALVEDITERKRAEQELRASEERYRVLAENMSDTVWLMDMNLKTIYISPSVIKLRGYTLDELNTLPLDQQMTPESLATVMKLFAENMSPERVARRDEPIVATAELEFYKKDGSSFWSENTFVLIRDTDGNPINILGSGRDITERRKAQAEVQQRVKELEVLYESGLTLSRLLEPKEIGQKMIELLSSKLDWHHAAIRLYRPDTESIEVLAVSHPGMTEEEIEAQRQRLQGAAAGLGKGLSGWVIKHGKSVRSGNVKADKRYLATYPDIRSGVYVPIQAGGRTIGSIAVESEVPDAFSEQDERILATLASQSAVAFENARLYQEALHAAERRAVLHRAGREIAAAGLDLESVYASIHRAAADLMPFEVILVGQHDRERQEVELIYTFDSGERYPNARLPVGQGITGRVIQKRASICIRDYRKEKRDKTVPFGKGDARSILAVPMFAGASITGVISVQSYRPGLYSQEDQALLEMLAAYASAAIENARLYEQAQRRLRASESLGQASQALPRSLEIQPLMENLLAAARRAIPAAEKGTIVLQEANGELRIRAMAGYQDGRLLKLAFTPGTGFVMQVFEDQQPVCIDDVHANFRVPYANEIEEVNTVQSAISAPLTVKGEKIGVISLDNASRKSAFTNDDLQLLVSFASSAAVAIQNSRLYEQTTRRAERLAALSEVSQKLSHLLDLESIGETSIQAVESLLGWKHGSLWLVESDTRLHMLYHSTPDFEGKALQQELQRLRALIPGPGKGIIGWVVQHGEPVRCADVKLDVRYIEGSTDTRSELCVPLQSGGKTIGALNFESENENAFGEEDEQVLSTLAGEIAGAIERAHLFNQTQRRAGELGALAQVSSALRTATTRAEMIPVILDQLTKILRIDNAALLSHDPSTGENVVEVARGEWTKAIGMRVPSGEGVSGVVTQTQLPFLSDNVIAEEHFAARAIFHEPEAVAGMPLLVQKQSLGSLWMGRQKEKGQTLPLPFTEEEVRLLGSIADMTANALHRARLHEQAVRHADQMLTVNEIGHMLSETLDLEQVYARLTGAIHNLLPDVCGLYISLYNERNQTITCTSAQVDGASVDVKQLPPLPFDPEGKSRQSRVLLTGEALIVNDLAAASRQKTGTKPLVDPKQKPESALYVPMSSKDTPIGLIQVQSYTPNRFGQDDINLLSLVANTAAITIENARLFAETRKRLHYLSALHNIDAAISASVDLRVTLSIILENITKELNVDAAALLLMNAYSKTLEYTASRGFRARIIEGMRIRLGEGLAGQAAIQRRMIGLTDADQGNLDLFGDEKFTAQFAVPLIAKGQVQGVLQVFHRSALEPDLEWTSFLNTLAGQAAIAMDNARLFEDLQRSNLELTLAYDATIQGWSQAMELRDKETQGHTNRVTELTMRLAREIGLSDAETVHLRRGVLLHDIGKMGVPDAILLKPGSLTEEEWEIMRMHPVYAFEMLSGIPYLHQALDVPYCHHEKWDGSGYPRGLKEEQIPISARLFAVVDVYDAVTSDRPYRSAWTREQALEYLREQSGKHFDPQVVEVFLKMEM